MGQLHSTCKQGPSSYGSTALNLYSPTTRTPASLAGRPTLSINQRAGFGGDGTSDESGEGMPLMIVENGGNEKTEPAEEAVRRTRLAAAPVPALNTRRRRPANAMVSEPAV
jgi:hypothetical protein